MEQWCELPTPMTPEVISNACAADVSQASHHHFLLCLLSCWHFADLVRSMVRRAVQDRVSSREGARLGMNASTRDRPRSAWKRSVRTKGGLVGGVGDVCFKKHGCLRGSTCSTSSLRAEPAARSLHTSELEQANEQQTTRSATCLAECGCAVQDRRLQGFAHPQRAIRRSTVRALIPSSTCALWRI